MIILTDLLREPFDEGAKIATTNLVEQTKSIDEPFVISINSKSKLRFIDESLMLNKLLFQLSFYRNIKSKGHRNILYIPEASATFFSFIRARLLKLFTGSDVCILSLQPRRYGFFQQFIIKLFLSCSVITQSQSTSQLLSRLGIPCKILPLGVDPCKYRILSDINKKKLRLKYKVGLESTVLLHVGHIQSSRNLDWLIRVKRQLPHVELIIVGSTYNKMDEKVFLSLKGIGIRIIREYIPNMEEIYNMADYYVFPVLRNDGAIETPLSVLEAMSCNVPIITSRFGNLPDIFAEDDNFRFVSSSSEIVEIVKAPKKADCMNRDKIKPYTWREIARKLIEIIE